MADSHENKGKIIADTFDAPGSVVNEPAADSGNVYNHTRLEIKNEQRWWHSQFNLMLCVFALLGVAALLFVSLSPAPSGHILWLTRWCRA